MTIQMKCSRSSLRVALKMLENNGVIYVKGGALGGYIVKDSNLRNVAQTINLMYQIGNFTIVELLEVRKIIEVSCINYASDRINEDEIDLLTKNVKELYNNYDEYEFLIKNNREFHLLIASFSGNKLLKILCETMMDAIDSSVYQLITTEDKGYELYLSHKDILEALISKNKDKAIEAMNKHINAIKINWKNHINHD